MFLECNLLPRVVFIKYFRFIVCPNKVRFITIAANIVEFFAITLFLMFYFLFLLSSEFIFGYYFCQYVFGSFKIFALTRMTCISWRLETLSKTIKASVTELMLAFFYLAVSLLVVSNLMFYLELFAGNKVAFESVFKTMWWAVVTMTTVHIVLMIVA